MMASHTKKAIAGRTAEIAVGLAYLLAAGLKAWNFNLFIGQILAYQIFSSTGALTAVAFTTLALEVFLGTSMVLGSPLRKFVLGAGFAMLLFFTGLIVFAWQVHDLKDCGCFGKVSMTPPQAILKNMVFVALTALAWFGLVAGGRTTAPMSFIKARKLGPIAVAVLIGLAVIPQIGGTIPAGNEGPTATGHETLPPDGEAQPAGEAGAFAGYRIVPDFGDPIDLARGEYLVALLSMTCPHCMDTVPEINAYTYETALPPVVAICLEPEEGSLEEFQGMTGPEFPMHSVGNDMLAWAKLCSGVPPQLCLVRDGVAVKTWSDVMPGKEELLEAVNGAGTADSAESVRKTDPAQL